MTSIILAYRFEPSLLAFNSKNKLHKANKKQDYLTAESNQEIKLTTACVPDEQISYPLLNISKTKYNIYQLNCFLK
jgi:hypothetical protein